MVGQPPPQVSLAALSKEVYTPWFTRVVALVIDYIPVLILLAIGLAYFVSHLPGEVGTCVTDMSEHDLGEFCESDSHGLSLVGAIVLLGTSFLAIAFVIWNYGYRQGVTGSSIGKSITKFKVVSEKTWEPVGFGMSIVRQLAHIVDGAICYVGYLFPLWDPKRQTLADKIMSTVCVPTDPPQQLRPGP